jgi:hypothetical protein
MLALSWYRKAADQGFQLHRQLRFVSKRTGSAAQKSHGIGPHGRRFPFWNGIANLMPNARP